MNHARAPKRAREQALLEQRSSEEYVDTRPSQRARKAGSEQQLLSETVVLVDHTLAASERGSVCVAQLQGLGCLVLPCALVVAHSLEWRRAPDAATLAALRARGAAHETLTTQLRTCASLGLHVLCLSAEELATYVREHTLQAVIEQLYAYYGQRVCVLLIVVALDKYFRDTQFHLRSHQRAVTQGRAEVSTRAVEDRMTREAYTAVMLELQLSEGIQVHECSNDQEASIVLAHWTRTLVTHRARSHAPPPPPPVPRLTVTCRRAQTAFENFCAEAAPRRAARHPAEAYRAALELIPGVSSAVASAIMTRYPTLRSLVSCYMSKQLSAEHKARLLENVEVSARTGAPGRRVGRVLSEKIYRLFSLHDGSVVL